MAYGKMDNPGSDMSEHEEGMHDESMHEEGMDHKQGYGSLYLSPSMLPEGMKANPGDILEFKVIQTDKDGDIEVTYNTGKYGEGKDEMEDWESDFRKEMSPREPEESA